VIQDSIKVSVVVPVYNPGRYLDPCVRSLLRQSLPPTDYEIVFVNDGSTDDSPEKLDKLAVEHPHVRVFHQENSGWPGKPRNVGIAHARGEYVQFVDQDDELGYEALERMYAAGVRNQADIVLGKVAGTMTGPNPIFARNVDRCTIRDFPLIDSLSPHKMFRRAFLDEHHIRFPEGKRRLEDQLFMAQAYLAARCVSIVADYPCYYWNRRDDRGNSSSTPSTMRGYYDNLREVMDAVVAGTEPGELRSRLLRRFFRVEMMRRLCEPRLLRYSDGYRKRGYQVVRKLAMERFTGPDGSLASGEVVAGLPPVTRLRAALLEHDRLDGLMELARRCLNVRGHAEVAGLRWEHGVLYADVRAGLVHADGSPVVVVEREGRYELDPTLVTGLPTITSWPIDDPCQHAEGRVRLFHREAGLWWYAPNILRPTLEPVRLRQTAPGAADPLGSRSGRAHQVVLTGTISLDPQTLAAGSPLQSGRHAVWVAVRVLGLGRAVRLTVAPGEDWRRGPDPALVGDPARVVVPHKLAPFGQLALDVDDQHQSLAAALASRGIGPLRTHGPEVRLTVPMQAAPGSGAREVEVVIGRQGSSHTLPARLQPTNDAVLAFPRSTALPSGRYPLAIRTDPSGERPAVPIGTAVVEDGRITTVRGISYRALARRILARMAAEPWLHRQAFRAIAALPDGPAERARTLARRLARWSQEK
jgi:glycosyltransferase involved in cell wall biosynthesis